MSFRHPFYDWPNEDIIRRKLRTWWINEAKLAEINYDPSKMFSDLTLWNLWFNSANGYYIRTTKPDDATGWICVKEMRIK